jgi:Domain of unknown function (DUF1707)
VPSLRASDSDRDQIAERLRDATVEGRLGPDELEERLDALYSSRTYGELDALVADLPAPASSSRPPSRMPRWAPLAAAAMALLLVLGMFSGVHRTTVVVGNHQQQYRWPGPFTAPPHHGLLLTAPIAGVLTIVAVGVAVGWLLMRFRHATGA